MQTFAVNRSAAPGDERVAAVQPPQPSEFPAYPPGWHLFGSIHEVVKGEALAKDLFGRRVVVWRTGAEGDDALVALDGRCCHLGTDLGDGCVVDGALQCPFHHWEFEASGKCRRIPAQAKVPPNAGQSKFGLAVRAGFIFVTPSPGTWESDRPFFQDLTDDELVASPAFEFDVECPWYLVGANGFDVQHFRAAHDRVLIGEPKLDTPARFTQRIVATFAVTGNRWRDRLTQLIAGPSVEMRVTDWCGSLSFVEARFARTTSYGMVSIRPVDVTRTIVQFTVFARAARGLPHWLGIDRLNACIKRQFIKAFLQSDAERLRGATYSPGRLIEADATLKTYFRNLVDACQALGEQES